MNPRTPLLRSASAAVVAGLVAAACGDADPGGAVSSDPSPFCQDVLARVDSFMATREEVRPAGADPSRYGGTVVVAGIGPVADGMNGFVSSDYVASQHQGFVNAMTLVRYDADLTPVPYLAESWEVDDDDEPTAVTFHLRDDVYWHDGEKVDAYDVAFTWERVTDPETAFPNSAFWDPWVKGPEGVEVVDSLTVTLRMERTHAEFMDPWRTTMIMPEHLLGDVEPSELARHPYGTRCPVGNGPFVFVEHRPQESWTFRANPAFPEDLGGRPYLDRYVYRIIPEQTTILTELLTGGIDVYIAPRPDQARDIIDSERADLRNYIFRNYVFVGWNSRRPQLSDPRVRRAITVGTNRREIVDAILQGYGVVANTGVPPFHWAFDDTFTDSLGYDPEQARRLLDEAGWVDSDGDGIRDKDGLDLSFSVKYNTGNQQRQDIAEIMQAQLREVGMDVQPQVVEWTTLLSQINSPDLRDFDGVVMAWVTEFRVDDANLFHSEALDAPYQWAGTRNPELDRLLDTLQVVVDRSEALPLWREYQALILEEMPYTYFYFPERLDGVSKRLRNVEMDVRGEWINIKDWWIPAEERRRRSAAP